MSNQLVDRSPDLIQLINEEYDLEIRDTNLLVHHIPFVNSEGSVAYGTLVSELSTNAERTVQPGSHQMWLVGGVPYDHQGQRVAIVNDPNPHDFGGGLIASCGMSAKRRDEPPANYHIKVTTYVDILSRYARAINPEATHKNAPPRESSAEESVFRYHDSATSRSGLSAVTAKLKLGKLAIVGLGGTGSYILDLVAKTPVVEIHLYDDDVLYAHNAFRAPGAASFDELRQEPLKVNYLQQLYDPMRRNIVAHPVRVSEANVSELQDKEFVFLAVDSGPDKQGLIGRLMTWGIPFVDCGMGISRQENSLRGMIRATAGETSNYSHIPTRISFADEGNNEYDWNIQTAELNMMNAVLAVLKWKKMLGYYVDSKHEYNTTFTVARNQLVNGDFGT